MDAGLSVGVILGVFPVLGQPNLDIRIDRAKSARYGLNTGDVDAVIQAATGGASATTVLEGDESLLVAGQLDIDLFGDEFVAIPLALRGGVLARAELDGKPARLSVATAQPEQRAKKSASVAPALLLLHVSGRGHHKLELEVRLRLTRQGGWRVADGQLPTAAASSDTQS